jgi:ribosomal protein S27AE
MNKQMIRGYSNRIGHRFIRVVCGKCPFTLEVDNASKLYEQAQRMQSCPRCSDRLVFAKYYREL